MSCFQGMGAAWDETFAKDIMLVVDESGDGSIEVDEFWEWYKNWSRQLNKKASFKPEVSVGFTIPPTLTQMRRDRARLRLDSVGQSMTDKINSVIIAASIATNEAGSPLQERQGSATGGVLNMTAGLRNFLGGGAKVGRRQHDADAGIHDLAV
jgi:hypothetical protein